MVFNQRDCSQCQNFLRFCELAVKSCENLKRLSLVTGEDKADQAKWLASLQHDLSSRFRIQLDIVYSSTLHDREIRYLHDTVACRLDIVHNRSSFQMYIFSINRLDNGWVIKIGRGLDYFKSTEHKFMLGCHDYDLRKCHETTVDIFHREFVKKAYG